MHVLAFGAGLDGGQQVLQRSAVILLVQQKWRVTERLRALLAEAVDDPVAGNPHQPGTGLLDWLHQTVRSHELVEHFLEDVFRLGGIQHPTANEVPQTTALAPHSGGDLSILFGCHGRVIQRHVHL